MNDRTDSLEIRERRTAQAWAEERGKWLMWNADEQMPIVYRRKTEAELRKHRLHARWFFAGVIVIYIAMAAVGGPY